MHGRLDRPGSCESLLLRQLAHVAACSPARRRGKTLAARRWSIRAAADENQVSHSHPMMRRPELARRDWREGRGLSCKPANVLTRSPLPTGQTGAWRFEAWVMTDCFRVEGRQRVEQAGKAGLVFKSELPADPRPVIDPAYGSGEFPVACGEAGIDPWVKARITPAASCFRALKSVGVKGVGAETM